MRVNNIDEIIIKSFDDTLMESERIALDSWLNESEENLLTFQQMKQIFQASEGISLNLNSRKSASWENIEKSISGNPSISTRKTIIRLMIRSAAAILILVSAGLILNNTLDQRAGKYLNNNPFVLEYVLKDGSEVFLKPGSELKLDKGFDKTNRNISLEGEAYFKVVKNTALPFIVSGGNATSTAIGTEFNFRAYPHFDNAKVYVTEGTVKVEYSGNLNILMAGQEAKWNFTSTEVSISNSSQINYSETSAKELVFNNDHLEDVCRILSQYFQIRMIADADVKDKKLTSKFIDPDKKQVLNILSKTLSLKITEQGDQILLSKSE